MFKRTLFIISLAALLPSLLMAAQPCQPAHAEEPGTECWAVIIGIAEYQFPGYCLVDGSGNKYCRKVRYPDDSARDLFQQLAPVLGEDHIKLLLNNHATKTDIYYAIKWLADKVDSDDIALIYFCGHGDQYGKQGYLCTFDSQPANYSCDISDSELDEWLDQLYSEKIVVMLDTCHAGSFSNKLGNDKRVILMGCRQGESSFEDAELKHAVFTHYILQALDDFETTDINYDYELSAEEIFDYAEPKTVMEVVAPYANLPPISKGDRQHPVLYAPGYSDELSLLMKVTFHANTHFPSDTTILTLDNKSYIAGELPISFTWVAGSAHNFDIVPQIDTEEGTRFLFTSWDDEYASASRTISQGGEYSANYKEQHQLTIDSIHGDLKGNGWYDSDSIATFSVTCPKGIIIRQVFTGWSGDLTETTETASVRMDAPKTITANWRTDYLQLYILIVSIITLSGVVIAMRKRS